MSLTFCILASGSSGNCSAIWTDKTALLIDFGCSSKYLTENLDALAIPLNKVEAVLITHAHMDHISASGLNFIAKNNIPICACENVLGDIYRKYSNKVKNYSYVPFTKSLNFGNLAIESFDVHHKDINISQTLGFVFVYSFNEKKYKIGYVTDTGKICGNIMNKLANSNILVIESNYDRVMLDASFRPYNNKQWVLSNYGHLSNEDAGIAICKIKKMSPEKNSLKHVFLAHISQHHNTPELALKTAKNILQENNVDGIQLFATKRRQRSHVVRII